MTHAGIPRNDSSFCCHGASCSLFVLVVYRCTHQCEHKVHYLSGKVAFLFRKFCRFPVVFSCEERPFSHCTIHKQQKAKPWFGNEAIRPKSTVIAKHLSVGHVIMQVRQGRPALVRSYSEQKTSIFRFYIVVLNYCLAHSLQPR